LVVPDSAEILIDDAVVAIAQRNLPDPEQRGIGMVFQDPARWPHMTVAENIEFGLRARRAPTKERGRRVRDMVDLVELGEYSNAMPNELSGGQQ